MIASNITSITCHATRLASLQNIICLSQWPCSLRHETSSSPQKLGSRVRIPFEAWMSVRVYSVSVLSCLGSGLATGLFPRPRSPTNCLQDSQFQINSDEEKARGPYTKGIRRRRNNEAFQVWAVARNVFKKCVHFSRLTVFVHDLQGI
jgi:hypothetical protein